MIPPNLKSVSDIHTICFHSPLRCTASPGEPRIPDLNDLTPSGREVVPEVRHASPVQSALSPSALSCDTVLVQRCPTCFRGNSFSQSLINGADIYVATDSNFHHQHRCSAGESPVFYNLRFFLPKSQVDAVNQCIEQARKRPVHHQQARVPDEAVDHCKSTHEAADGKKQKSSMDSYDDTGIMVLICRHDIPLFFANIDSPGEQQKYSIALIEHLFSLLPPAVTVVVLYDIGCVVKRSITQVHVQDHSFADMVTGRFQYDILGASITSRLRFTTTAMHAYGHEWACQLEYNPQLIQGLGLTDSEGTERLWS